jgi:hypothetical protein
MNQVLHWRWRNSPQLVRRFYLRMLTLPALVSVTLIAAALLNDSLFRMRLLALGVVLALVAVLFSLWLFAIGTWERRLLGRLRAARYRLCPRCGYELVAHDGQCTCPECGTTGNLDEIHAAWRLFRPKISADRS